LTETEFHAKDAGSTCRKSSAMNGSGIFSYGDSSAL